MAVVYYSLLDNAYGVSQNVESLNKYFTYVAHHFQAAAALMLSF